MGFKADASFLKFLSMGAFGAQQAIEYLSGLGFSPIELERYSTSNKIWATKVKRLRLPDLLCVNTGMRVEVRAKSDLKIRMSDTPAKPDRTWDAGLRDQDLTAFIVCQEVSPGVTRTLGNPIFFTVGSLRESVGMSSLGAAKSASEGAERDRTWPSSVPKADGEVIEINEKTIVTRLDKEGGTTRRQTYQLKGKTPYVSEGDRFLGNVSILAGAPREIVDIREYLNLKYDPIADLASSSAVDRYSAIKSLRYRSDLAHMATTALWKHLAVETDDRVLLEASASGIALDIEDAYQCLRNFLYEKERADLRMEAVFILTEIANDFAKGELLSVANNPRFQNDEIRQAAVWGLGKAGLKAYEALLDYIDDAEPAVSLHAITAFGSDASEDVVDQLIAKLMTGTPRTAAVASETLRIIGNESVIFKLINIAKSTTEISPWLIATLGRINSISAHLNESDELYAYLAPFQVLSQNENWLADENISDNIKFLLKQDIF